MNWQSWRNGVKNMRKDLLNATTGVGFSHTHQPSSEVARYRHCAQNWGEAERDRETAMLSNCGAGVGSTWTGNGTRRANAGRRMESGDETTTEISRCNRGNVCMREVEGRSTGPHDGISETPQRSRKNNRVRDKLAQQLWKLGATTCQAQHHNRRS